MPWAGSQREAKWPSPHALTGPRDLPDAKAFPRRKLELREHPLHFVDEAAAGKAIDRLQGLNGEHWAAARRPAADTQPLIAAWLREHLS